ncbi:Hypothetical predicted protein [Podarcis lilfordi]|uniref:Uncharacterized protein n=1 Tax=Podarcis lilfordi TaxID=74358 RepID=A0AA35NZ91_9SAUR|nr:Hypothetical predicted protein [Podarcis lilfordi]
MILILGDTIGLLTGNMLKARSSFLNETLAVLTLAGSLLLLTVVKRKQEPVTICSYNLKYIIEPFSHIESSLMISRCVACVSFLWTQTESAQPVPGSLWPLSYISRPTA